MNRFAARCQRAVLMVAVTMALVPLGGCAFSERSFLMRHGDLHRLPDRDPRIGVSTRAWLAETHARLTHLLPHGKRRALVTEDLVDASGRPIDVLDHFGLTGKNLRTLWYNGYGISDTAQAIGGGSAIDQPAPPWDGFNDVLIPVSYGVQLSGRMGLARTNGHMRDADCIVILPGLFGDNSIFRTRDLAAALRASGFHVLALEVRAHGRTEALNPNAYSTFGVLETVDLLLVSEWLEALPHVQRTGLIGFCWGANMGLLAAWYDGRPKYYDSITPKIAAYLQPVSDRAHYRAGIIACSAVWDFERLIAEMETPTSFLRDPILGTMQNTMRGRCRRKHHPEITYSLRKLIDYEFARSEVRYPGVFPEAVRFLRLMPNRGPRAAGASPRTSTAKLAGARVPVLVVHAANDPLCPAQDVADMMASVTNPNVAALILPGGGHVGFAPFARAYYFSLIVNFFDPRTGPAA